MREYFFTFTSFLIYYYKCIFRFINNIYEVFFKAYKNLHDLPYFLYIRRYKDSLHQYLPARTRRK